MLDIDVIEPALAEWASQIAFVLKKDGILRFSMEYRMLNAVTIRDSYLILRMEECIEFQYFRSFELYLHVSIDFVDTSN